MANVMMPIKQEPSSNFILANLTDAESILSIRDLKHRYDLHESLQQVHHKMASTVPIHQAPQSSGSTHGSGTSESEMNSSLSLDVLRGLTEKKGVRSECLASYRHTFPQSLIFSSGRSATEEAWSKT